MTTDIYPAFGLEDWPDDPNRVRVFNPITGARSDWISRLQHSDMWGTLVVPEFAIRQAFPEWTVQSACQAAHHRAVLERKLAEAEEAVQTIQEDWDEALATQADQTTRREILGRLAYWKSIHADLQARVEGGA